MQLAGCGPNSEILKMTMGPVYIYSHQLKPMYSAEQSSLSSRVLCSLLSLLSLYFQGGSQKGMAKEEDVKKIELKVSVNCCDGCRKKVMKAISMKGVLKTDIHPTLPKVTVVGNVEPQTLIKKLAKCGKTTEPWPAEPKKQEKEEKKTDGGVEKAVTTAVTLKGGNEKAKDSTEVGKKSGGSETEKNLKSEDKSKCKHGDNRCCRDGDKGESKSHKEAEIAGSEVVKNVNPNCSTATLPTTVTALPQVNYVVNPGMVQDPDSMAAAYPPRVYCAVEPYPPPVTYYTANVYTAPAPLCCVQDLSYHHSPPVYNCPPTPQLVPSLPPHFGDYFNDENTVGCNVM